MKFKTKYEIDYIFNSDTLASDTFTLLLLFQSKNSVYAGPGRTTPNNVTLIESIRLFQEKQLLGINKWLGILQE